MLYSKQLIPAVALLAAALVASCHERTASGTSLEVRVYPVGQQGFGYALYQGGRKIIDQPDIPAIPSLAPFRSREEAERTAQLVSQKLEARVFPPAVTIRELDSLRIRY
jgi:hypothetical protein